LAASSLAGSAPTLAAVASGCFALFLRLGKAYLRSWVGRHPSGGSRSTLQLPGPISHCPRHSPHAPGAYPPPPDLARPSAVSTGSEATGTPSIDSTR